MIEERVGFRVQGKVQGVGFRMWVRYTGTQLGLRGSVRNLKDGDAVTLENKKKDAPKT